MMNNNNNINNINNYNNNSGLNSGSKIIYNNINNSNSNSKIKNSKNMYKSRSSRFISINQRSINNK